MAARAIASGTISFGLVSIPVKLYTAASSESVSFNMLHKKCGGRIKQQLFCPTDNEVVERTDTVKGYEHARGQYVQFTEEELKAFESERSNAIEITEFVPIESVDFVHVEKSYYLGPDKGGDKAYKLLSEAMDHKTRVAVGRWAARGKEQLVLIRPYADGLILHQLYYANEVRAWDEIDTGAKLGFSDKERDLAEKLIEQL
ncbi:MAG TPA: Ku protein, partial [Polyangiaceae bacterium]|nr:Ku protein [Polyangiaceae bacterium]